MTCIIARCYVIAATVGTSFESITVSRTVTGSVRKWLRYLEGRSICIGVEKCERATCASDDKRDESHREFAGTTGRECREVTTWKKLSSIGNRTSVNIRVEVERIRIWNVATVKTSVFLQVSCQLFGERSRPSSPYTFSHRSREIFI